jgi:protocatechuate 3,4-dioxygenase alpha subunit
MKLTQTPSQTVGPYFAYGLTSEQYGYDFKSLFGPLLAQPQAEGEHIRLTGRVFDGDGVPINDAMLEIRQPDARGRFVASRAEAVASGFCGFGRCGTGTHPGLHYWFDTVKPGAAAPGEAPCIDVIVTMRGTLLHAFTRIYFDDEAEANARDPVLAAVPAERRATLIAKRQLEPGGVSYLFDVRMQGPKETVFFDL